MRKSKTAMAVQTLTRLALLGAVALVLGWVESFLPTPYGIKLGLANTVLLYALYLLDVPSAFVLMVLKVFLSLLTPGGGGRFLYTAAGAVLSLLAMLLVKAGSREKVSMIGVSVVGAIFHNVGQMLVAAAIFGVIPILAYSPLLLLTGVVLGIVTGTVGRYAIRALAATGAGNPKGKTAEPKEDRK